MAGLMRRVPHGHLTGARGGGQVTTVGPTWAGAGRRMGAGVAAGAETW